MNKIKALSHVLIIFQLGGCVTFDPDRDADKFESAAAGYLHRWVFAPLGGRLVLIGQAGGTTNESRTNAACPYEVPQRADANVSALRYS